MNPDKCKDHTPGAPSTYVPWHLWAWHMTRRRGLRQKRCPGCGKPRIWVPR